jgi:hypothetical protein
VINNQQSVQPPTEGGIYRDWSDNSFAVVKIVGNDAILEYANGAITSIDLNQWYFLDPRPAAS